MSFDTSQLELAIILRNQTQNNSDAIITGVIPISLLLLATGTVLRKAAIDRGVRLATVGTAVGIGGSRVERFWRGHGVCFIVYTRYRVFSRGHVLFV